MRIMLFKFDGNFYNRVVLKDNYLVCSVFNLVITGKDAYETTTNRIKSSDGEASADFLEFINSPYTIRPKHNHFYFNYYVDQDVLGKEVFQDDLADTDFVRVMQFKGAYSLDFSQPRTDFSFQSLNWDYRQDICTAFTPSLAMSYHAKQKYKYWAEINQWMRICIVYMPSARSLPYADENSMEVVSCYRCPADIIDMRTDAGEQKIDTTSDLQEDADWIRLVYPRCKVIMPKSVMSGEVAHIRCELRHRDPDKGFLPEGPLFEPPVKLMLDTSGGYLPVNRKYTENGIAEFDLYTDHVPPGTTIKVKVNADVFTNVGAEIIQVC